MDTPTEAMGMGGSGGSGSRQQSCGTAGTLTFGVVIDKPPGSVG